MSKFDSLTKYISIIKSDSIGEWIVNKENGETSDLLFQMLFMGYSRIVNKFQKDLFKFFEELQNMITPNIVRRYNRTTFNLVSIRNSIMHFNSSTILLK